VPGEVLFIDEIHWMARSAEEMLYLAMEDFRIDIMVGKEPGPPASRSIWRRSPSSARPPGRVCCPTRCATGSGSPRTWSITNPTSSNR
jgi:hypothetical protein